MLTHVERRSLHAARAGQPVEVDLDANHRGGIGRRIDAVPAIEPVGAAAAHQGIVAEPAEQAVLAQPANQHVRTAAALEHIVVGAAGQGVGEVRADEPLDAADAVAGGVATDPDAAVEARLAAPQYTVEIVVTAAMWRPEITTSRSRIS